MPTPEEIKKIARKFAELKGGHAVCSETEIQKRALLLEQYTHFLMEDFCIVPKSKVKENYQSLKNDIPDFKQDPKRHCGFLGGMTELELLFGAELFNEEKGCAI